MFDEKFIKELPSDILEAQAVICKRFAEADEAFGIFEDRISNLDKYLQALAFAEIFIGAHSLNIKIPSINLRSNDHSNVAQITEFFSQWRPKVEEAMRIRKQTSAYESAKDYYSAMFGKGVFYEFSDADFAKIQKLLNKLRDLLQKSKDFEEGHRSRLLKKLEALQSELHKRMSDFDKFWGFFIDSGIALSKFWENAKPFRDDVKEVLQIVARTQAKAENVQKILPLNLLMGSEDKSASTEKEQIGS